MTTSGGNGGDGRFVVFTNSSSPQQLDLGALIRSLPQVTNKVQGFGGGKIQLHPGVYFTGTNGLFVGNPFDLELCGSAYGQTAIVFTNMNGTTPGLCLASTNGNCLSVYIHDLYLCTTTDTTNAILSITNTARDHLARLVICPWTLATNANGEAGGRFGASTNNIGLNIASLNGQQTILEDISLTGLWVGAAIGVDHLRILGYLGLEVCGGGGVSAAWGTNIYCVGGGLFLNGNFNDDVISGIHSYSTPISIVNNVSAAPLGQLLVIGGDTQEEGYYRSLTATTNGPPIVFLFHHHFGGGRGHDGTLAFDGSSWSILDRSPVNVVDLYQDGIGTKASIHFGVGGQDFMVLGDYTGRGNAGIVLAADVIAKKSLSISNLVTLTNFDFYNITISASTNAGVNGNYTYARTNSKPPYVVLTNGYSANVIVMPSPSYGTPVLQSANDIGVDARSRYYPTLNDGTLASINGPWTVEDGVDAKVYGQAAILSYPVQIKDDTVSAPNFAGNGHGLTNFNIIATTDWSTVFGSALIITNKAYTNRSGHALSVQVPVKWHHVPGHKSELVLNVDGAKVSHAGFDDGGSVSGKHIFMDGNVSGFVPVNAVVLFDGSNLDQFTIDGVPQITIWP